MATRAQTLVNAMLLGDAVANGPLPVFVHDEEGRIVAVNDAAAELTGYSRDELLALPAQELNIMVSRDERSGTRQIVCRDGNRKTIGFLGGETIVSGLPYLVVALWEER